MVVTVTVEDEMVIRSSFSLAGHMQIRYKTPGQILSSDLRMHRIDGLEALKIIKTTPSLLRITVVILTSSDTEKDIATSYDYHANSYLVKSFDFNSFNKLMKDLGTYWLDYNVKSPAD